MPTLPYFYAPMQHGEAPAEQSLGLAMALGGRASSANEPCDSLGCRDPPRKAGPEMDPPPPTLGVQAATGAAHGPISTRVQALAHTARVGCHIAPGEPGRDSRHPIARMGRWNE